MDPNEPDEMMDVVDARNEVIGQATKQEVYAKLLDHRIVHVLVFNKAGNLLLQLRSDAKSYFPSGWVTSAGGHVQAGESYEDAAAREMEEELGVLAPLEPLGDDVYEDARGMRKFLRTFKAIHEGPFVPDTQEVERVAFFPLGIVHEMLQTEKVHPELRFLLEKHF